MKMLSINILLVAVASNLYSSCLAVSDEERRITVDDCGRTKGCVRYPAYCSDSVDCVYLLTWQNGTADNEIQFEYAAAFQKKSAPAWAGFGIAPKPEMPDASVVDCISNDNGVITIQMSYNVDHDNKPLNDSRLGLVNGSLQGSVVDGHIMCFFTRLLVITETSPDIDKVKNLTRPYYALFASGPTDGNGTKQIHDFNSDDPLSSSTEVDFSQLPNIQIFKQKSPLVRVHVILMILAWMVLASAGMFISRYMKNQWVDNGSLCSMPIWFQVHRILMVSVFGLTVIGILIIFAYKNWTFIPPHLGSLQSVATIHPSLGIAAGGLLLINVIVGMLRPQVNSPYRTYFRWVHGILGHGGHILAAVTMFFGVMQHDAQMHEGSQWIVVAFICWRLLADVVMTALLVCYKDQSVNYVALANNEVDEATVKVSALNCSVMIVYFIGVAVLAVALIVMANIPF